MEGDRSHAFTAPAWAAGPGLLAPRRPAAAVYCPTGWRKRRKQEGGSGDTRPCKRRRSEPRRAAPAAAAADTAAQAPLNPAQLVPLRCSWPHPAVLDLLAQQCWPAAGPAVVVQGAGAAAEAAPPPGRQADAWNRMLPSLSLLHAPLGAERQALLLGGGKAVQLPEPSVLVGYEDDWLEVAPQVLPLWQVTPLAPFAAPKPLLHVLVCPQEQAAAAQQFVKDVGSLYEACSLGRHLPASDSAVRTFALAEEQPRGQQQQQQQPQQPPAGTAAAGDGVDAAAAEAARRQRYLAGLREACTQLQLQLLLDPPEELQEQQGSSLEEGPELALLVYLACPLRLPEDRAAALLEAASCLAPCTPLGAGSADGEEEGMALLPTMSSMNVLSSGALQQMLAPADPAPAADRPAITTPENDNSRAPGGGPTPPGAEADEAAAAQQQQEEQQGGAAEQQQRYHGAERIAHQQQQGDFRCLPLRVVQRPAGSRPVGIVLHLLPPEALEDLSGTAAKCTAFAVYSKAQQRVSADARQQQRAQLKPPPPAHDAAVVRIGSEEPAPPASLPLCSQPLFVLASAVGAPSAQGAPPAALQQQQQQQGGGGSDSSRTVPPRTLHCYYGRSPRGTGLLPLAFTDSCGELLHTELLHTAGGRLDGLASAGSSGDSLAGEGGGGEDGSEAAGRMCRLVLQRCLELLRSLRAATTPANLLCSVAIASVGMPQAERDAWAALLAGRERALAAELPPGGEAAVLSLEALPPARFAGPDPPTGCRLVMQQGAAPQQACVAWLPPAGGPASALLPHEHDCVRQLEVALVARHGPAGAAAAAAEASGDPAAGERECLQQAVCELHGLSWLHAAFQGACLRTVAGGGQAAPADAHLPLHAALGERLLALLAAAAPLASSDVA